MSRDTIYQSGDDDVGPFEFNDDVATVFPDMLKRSIPGYAATIQAIGSLAKRRVRPNSNCYDLGCSLGAASLAMIRNIDATGCRIIAVDNSVAMVGRCAKALQPEADKHAITLDVVEADIQDVRIEQASLVAMNYTLQFIPLESRAALVRNIAAGMSDGGVFVLSEKVVDEDPEVEANLVDLHHEFKRQNAYSDLEIARKRAALENVLIPETVAAHTERLKEAGFRHVGVWLRHFNFVSMIAFK